MRIKGIKIDEDVARIFNEQDKDDTSKYRVYSNDIKDGWSILGTYDDEYSALQVYDAWKLRLLRGNGRYGVYTDVRMFKPGEKAIFSGWASLYDYVSKAFDRLAAGYSHPSQVPDFLQTRDLLEKLTKHELKLAKQDFFEEDLQAALDRWFEEVDDYTNESINKNSKSEKENEIKIGEDVARILNEQDNDFPEGSFAAWYGEDLSGQTYEGDLYCAHQNLMSLFGCPSVVIGDFDCSYNQLTSLEGAPKEVEGDFDCSRNQLTSLKGAPKEVGESFDCSYNQLTSLEWSPEKVGGYFNCYDNYLTSLEGAPEKVGGYFSCSNTRLTTLKGAPKEIGGDFYCNNNKLTSLEGSPKEVAGDFYCYDNRLKSLDGIGEVKGKIYSDID